MQALAQSSSASLPKPPAKTSPEKPTPKALQGVFLGTVGNKPVVLRIRPEQGKYFFRSDGLDIRLAPEFKPDGQIVLREISPTRRKGSLEGTWNNGGFKGSYVRGNQIVAPVEFRRLEPADLSSTLTAGQMERWKRTDAYTYLKFDQSFQLSRVVRFRKTRMVWYSEPKSGVRLARFEGKNYSSLNKALLDEHLRMAAQALECNLGRGTGWQPQVQLAWLAYGFVSFNITNDIYCGGPYRDRFPTSLTFNRFSGEKLSLEDFYRIRRMPRGFNPAEPDWTEFWPYLKAKEQALVNMALFNNPRVKLNPRCWGEESGLEPTDILNASRFYLTPQNLVLQVDFPQGMNECDQEFPIPYPVLRFYRLRGRNWGI
jgi:hypothetical protein